MIKSKRLLAAGLAVSLVLAACGDDDDDDASGPVEDTTEATDAADDTTATTEAEGDDMAEDEGDDMAEDETPATTAAPDEGDDMVESDLTVGLTFDLLGRGDQSFNDSAAAGIDRAIADFGISVNEVTPTDASARGTDLQLQAENAGLVIGVGFSFASDLASANDECEVSGVALENPDVPFAIVDDSMLNFCTDPPSPLAENVAGLVFSEEQGSYLVGVAAALKSTTGKVGFIGGVSGIGLIERFEAGFIAGAKSINPDIEVASAYITEFPDFAGFEDPARAKEIADAMYSEGADIVYAAAGLSGSGMFQAAAEVSAATGTKVWGIGVDSDQYNTVDPAVQEFVLTSMLKRVDVAVYEVTKSVVEGNFQPGEVRYDLAVDGVGYSTSGGFVDDIVDQLEAAKAAIVSGDVVVPNDPADA
ncbi:MAG: BMP family ABC transporter substrate-binding protein [Ilumatobacter sp.]|uniref:BMP family lipoprotein n=1 Tax=Ilumatobacter sp. TaxID=1967498 RepID=UPI0026032063|nr:BMP family ABC transporter substrate-binding protein [Ilumatobacter sp.]MDJ0767730.1 BMP family ABC transporter substrate-binding protein [Ilumatobacter sp.]